MKLLILNLPVTLKKGVTVETRWAVRQCPPHPRLVDNHCGELKWEAGNSGGLTSDYYGEPTPEKPTYYCSLLASDCTTEELEKAPALLRSHCAGWVEKHGETARPGSFAIRGVDMGEMDISFQLSGRFSYDKIRVRGFGDPSEGERNFIRENILPYLRGFATAKQAELHAIARAQLDAHFSDCINKARESLAKCEAHVAVMLARYDAASA